MLTIYVKNICRDCNYNCNWTPLSAFLSISLTRAAQGAITFTQGVLKSHNKYITMRIAWSTSQDTIRAQNIRDIIGEELSLVNMLVMFGDWLSALNHANKSSIKWSQLTVAWQVILLAEDPDTMACGCVKHVAALDRSVWMGLAWVLWKDVV